MKKIYRWCTMMVLLLTVFLLSMYGIRRRDEALAARIAPDILRFHVLANSDSAKDQTLKLAVKDFLLTVIQNDLTSGDDSLHINKDMVEQYILDNKSKLESMADTYIEEMGFDYSTAISLETCEFPQKTYGDMTFPAGMYDAVRVLIGDGAGENFWCVLYPSLCYIDSTYAVVPDSSKNALKALIAEAKTEQDPLLPRIDFRFKLVESLSAYLNPDKQNLTKAD